MSLMDGERENHRNLLDQVNEYYSQKIKKYGATHKGVDWNSQESQNLRFDQLLRIIGEDRECSVIDYGCGYGAMASYIRNRGYTGHYIGFDISEAMIKAAREQQSKLQNCSFVADAASLDIADYTIASGIFNVKQQIPNDQWQTYIVDTIHIMAEHSRKGFAFNMLTSHSDKNKVRPNLFYGDPCIFINHCISKYSRHVTMLHDYDLYEFTISVRLI